MESKTPIKYYSPIVQTVLSNTVAFYEKEKPTKIIKLEKQKNNIKLENNKNISTSIVHDFSCQSGDKAYKKALNFYSEKDLLLSVERMLNGNNSQEKKYGKARGLSRKQKRTQQAKIDQSRSYQQADKDRSRVLRNAFDNCAKYVAHEYEPQMNFGIEKPTMERITSWIAVVTRTLSRPFKVEVQVDPMGPIIGYIREFLNDEYNFILAFGSIATTVYFTRSTWAIMTLCAIVGYALNKHRDWISNIMKTYGVFDEFSISRWISDLTTKEPDMLFEDIDELAPQGVVDDYIDPISDGIFTLIFAKVFHTSYKNRSLTSLNRELGSFGRTKQGVTDFVNWFFQRLGKFVTWMGKILDTEVIDLVSFQDADVMDFSKNVAALVNDFDDGVTVNYDFFVRVGQIKKIGERLLSESSPSARDRRNALRSVLNKIQPLIDKCRAGNVVNNGPRRTPLAIIIGGSPGVGKSFTSVPFLHELIARVIDEKSLDYFKTNPNDYILNRVWENTFWDADHSQFCIVYDDFGQSPSGVLTKENEYMEVIRGVNSLNFPLTMASLVDKGSTNYQHQLVFATTNKSTFSGCGGVTSHEAVGRRFKLSVWLAPRKEYCIDPNVGITNRRLDTSKLQGVFDEDVHEFFDYDFINGKFLCETKSYTYREFIERSVLEYERNILREDAALSNMSASIDKGIALRRKLKPQDGDYNEYISFFSSMCFLAAGTMAALSVKYKWPNLGLKKVVGPQFGDGVFDDILATEIWKTDIPDVSMLAINRDLLAMAIAKVAYLDVELCRKIANSFTPSRDLLSWIREHRHEVDEAVRVELASHSSGFKKLLGGAIGAVRSVGNVMRSHPTLTKLATAALVMVPVLIKVRAFVTAMIPQSRTDVIVKNRQVHGRRAESRATRATNFMFQDQSSDIPAASASTCDFMQKVTAHNVYDFKLDSNRSSCGSILFICDNIAVMPMHYIDKMNKLKSEGYYSDKDSPAAAIRLTKPGTKNFYEFKPNQLEVVYDRSDPNSKTVEDIAFVRFKGLQAHKDITKFFVSKDSKIFDHNFDIALRIQREDTCIQMISKGSLSHCTYKTYSVETCIEYNLRTYDGDCGAVCYYNNPNSSSPIILGIHTAGSPSGYGVSYFIDKMHVENALSLFNDITKPPFEETEAVVPDGNLEEQMFISDTNGLEPDKPLPNIKDENKVAVDRVDKPHLATKSRIIPSKVYSKWGKPITKPAALRDFVKEGEVIKPHKKAIADYGGSIPVYSSDLLDCVTDEYISHLFAVSVVPQPWSARLWTIEEACKGIDGQEFCESIPRGTSPGYPLCLSTKKPGKQDFFGDGVDFSFGPGFDVLRERVDFIISQAKLAKRCSHVFMTFLKDERRKLAKVVAGDTRMISATDLAFLIVCRMYFGDFVRWYMSNRVVNGSAVGVNPYGIEWSRILRNMTEFDDKVIDGDYKGYDKAERQNLHSASYKVAEAYYSGCPEEDQIVRMVLVQEVLNPHYLEDGIVWSASGSMPSGSFFTTIFNTIGNNLILRYAVVASALQTDHRIATHEEFVPWVDKLRRELKFLALGDDNLWSVSGSFAEVVRPHRVGEVLSDLGYIYTASDKSALGADYKSIVDCTFLKRGFYRSAKHVLAPLDMNTIREMPYWTTTNAPPDNEYEVLCSALYELGMHSEPVFDKWAPKFIQASIKYYGKSPPFTSYAACRAKIRSVEAKY